MTATAFAHDPLLDQDFDNELLTARPQLHVIDGAGQPDPAPLPALALDPTVEVYRRRRFAALLALTLVVLVACQALGLSLTSFGPSAGAVDDTTPQVHVIRPGDTYAGIAAELGAAHPQSFADDLRAANGGAELVVGQRLVFNAAGLG